MPSSAPMHDDQAHMYEECSEHVARVLLIAQGERELEGGSILRKVREFMREGLPSRVGSAPPYRRPIQQLPDDVIEEYLHARNKS